MLHPEIFAFETDSNRSSDTDDTPDASREQLSDAEFTPVGFHLQQPSASATPSKEASFTCSVCAVAFPSLSTLILHKQSHRHEGCAGRKDGRVQQLEQESGRQKNPVVVLVSFGEQIRFTCDRTLTGALVNRYALLVTGLRLELW